MSKTESLAEEIITAHLGSFPISPGTMQGHKHVAQLYLFYRRRALQGLSVKQIFGEDHPSPPKLAIPNGHTTLTAIDGTNNSVWKIFLNMVTLNDKEIDVLSETHSLIQINASSDDTNFEPRLRDKRSRLFPGDPIPSLLRAFVFQDMFPYKNGFFNWVTSKMRTEILNASQTDYNVPWSSALGQLVQTWKEYFPNDPFIPTK